MQGPSHILSFNLPNQLPIKVHLVKLASGQTVARTEDELQAVPDELGVNVADLVPPTSGE